MLSDFFNIEKTIFFIACAAQDFVASCWGLTECCLCSSWPMTGPLLWAAPAVLRRHGSWPLPENVAGAFGSGFLGSLVQAASCFNLYYCGPNLIWHFFCDISQIISLSCSNAFIGQIIIFCGWDSFWIWFFPPVLWFHCSFHSENLHQRQCQGLSHLCLPCDNCDSLPWHRPLCVTVSSI